ncbi:MAG: Asd/ArgC dimerization domain-containing protein, partial [Gemmatimonadota bacterium]|nr:Asd/ArgC dimerization domain-containing protein [Gemmatimonadota bacterium]
NENILPYKIGRVHRHVGEMETVLSHFAGREMKVVFTPQLAPWSRGILSTVYVRTSKGAEKVRALYRETYSTTPFVTVLENGQPAQLAWVQHNNSCVIGVHEVAGSSYTMISSAVDNLVKGAAGQAVQNLNILFGLDETVGLAAASGRI